MIAPTEHCYIVRDDQVLSGEPIVKATRTPVRAVVEFWRLGYSPEEIPSELPHLTMAMVFDLQRSPGRDKRAHRTQQGPGRADRPQSPG